MLFSPGCEVVCLSPGMNSVVMQLWITALWKQTASAPLHCHAAGHLAQPTQTFTFVRTTPCRALDISAHHSIST